MGVWARIAKSAVGIAIYLLPLVACGGGNGEDGRQAAEDRCGGEETETTRQEGNADGESPAERDDDGESRSREFADGCEIVSKQEVEELLGREVQNVPPDEQTRNLPGMVTQCLWEATAPDAGTVAADLFQFQMWEGRHYYGAPPASERVEGIGDDANVAVGPSAGAIGRDLMVGFVDGDRVVLLSLSGVAEADVERMKDRMVDYDREVAEEV